MSLTGGGETGLFAEESLIWRGGRSAFVGKAGSAVRILANNGESSTCAVSAGPALA